MYGLELVNLSISMERSLAVVHTTVAKTIQGLTRQTAGPAVLSQLKWWSIHAFLANKCLTLLWRILTRSTDDISKHFVISGVLGGPCTRNRTPEGPVRLMMNSLSEYHTEESMVLLSGP